MLSHLLKNTNDVQYVIMLQAGAAVFVGVFLASAIVMASKHLQIDDLKINSQPKALKSFLPADFPSLFVQASFCVIEWKP